MVKLSTLLADRVGECLGAGIPPGSFHLRGLPGADAPNQSVDVGLVPMLEGPNGNTPNKLMAATHPPLSLPIPLPNSDSHTSLYLRPFPSSRGGGCCDNITPPQAVMVRWPLSRA